MESNAYPLAGMGDAIGDLEPKVPSRTARMRTWSGLVRRKITWEHQEPSSVRTVTPPGAMTMSMPSGHMKQTMMGNLPAAES